MTRVSLTESYDDRSVISKLNEMDKRVKENASVVTSAEASARQSAQSAQETADRFAGSVGAVVQNANAQINASKAQVDSAKAEVDETVTTVAQAVRTADQASASAQAGAQTVQTYDDRLRRAEVDIQALDGETADLYAKDAVNLKSNDPTQTAQGLRIGTHDLRHAVTTDEAQAITGAKVFDGWDNVTLPNVTYLKGGQPTNWKYFIGKDATGNYDIMRARRDALEIQHSNAIRTSEVGSDSRSIVTKAYVEATDEVTNNLMHRSANETVKGIKVFENGVDGQDFYHPCHVDNSADNIWKNIISFDYKKDRACIFDIVSLFNNNDVQNARIKVRMQDGTVGLTVIESAGTTEQMAKASNYVVTLTGTRVTIKACKRRRYTDLAAKLVIWHNYQTVEVPPEITYPNTLCADPSTETFDSMQIGTLVPYRNVA